MTKRRHHAYLAQDRRGSWYVKIELNDGKTNAARLGENQRVVYDRPENVPTHLKRDVVPALISEARARNLSGG